ncbi:MAG: hypothetical protein JXM68_11410 [Sedimentisphaerales bacterium]|nr:hypothetical protein [Sedimentisphaerales bacterium]
MSEQDKDKQVVKGYVIEDVPDTPMYANRRHSCENSWIYPAQGVRETEEVIVRDGNIIFSCECGKRVKIPVSFAGSKGKCPECGQVINIPRLSV